MITIGIGHISRTGKDTLQGFMVSHLKTTCKRDAQKGSLFYNVKLQAYNMFRIYGLERPEFYDDHPILRSAELPGIRKTPVDLWIEYGMFLQQYDQSILTKSLWATSYSCDILVVQDLRRVAECDSIHDQGGFVIRVDRPGHSPISDIDRELSDYDGWDAVVDNSKDLGHLFKETKRVCEVLKL